MLEFTSYQYLYDRSDMSDELSMAKKATGACREVTKLASESISEGLKSRNNPGDMSPDSLSMYNIFLRHCKSCQLSLYRSNSAAAISQTVLNHRDNKHMHEKSTYHARISIMFHFSLRRQSHNNNHLYTTSN